MIKNVLNGDGLILGFYGLIWLKLQEHKQQAFTNLILPHTIIYSNSVPTQWFYSNSDGLIMRKKQTSITKENIMKTLITTQQDICAYFITQQDEKQNNLEYLKGEDLDKFLSKSPHQNGLLQQFILPLGQYNFCIQIIWSSHLILFNKRTNINKMTNDKVPIHQRLATYDGNQALSTESVVTTQALSSLLQKIAFNIAWHIETVSYGQHITQGMVIYVKIDQNSKINLLFCTSARTNFAQTDNKKNTPMTLHQNLIHNPNKYKSHPCFYTKSKALKEIECVNCSLRQDPKDMIQCKLSTLIDHHERQPINVGVVETEKPIIIHMRKQEQNIPSIVLKLLPKLTMKDFEKKIDRIRNIKIFICGDCFLKYRIQEKEDYKFTSYKTDFKVNDIKYTNLVNKGLAAYRRKSQDDMIKSCKSLELSKDHISNIKKNSINTNTTFLTSNFVSPKVANLITRKDSHSHILQCRTTNNSIEKNYFGNQQKTSVLNTSDFLSEQNQKYTTATNSHNSSKLKDLKAYRGLRLLLKQ